MESLTTLTLACSNDLIIMMFITSVVFVLLSIFVLVSLSILIIRANKEIKQQEMREKMALVKYIEKRVKEDDYIKNIGLDLKYI